MGLLKLETTGVWFMIARLACNNFELLLDPTAASEQPIAPDVVWACECRGELVLDILRPLDLGSGMLVKLLPNHQRWTTITASEAEIYRRTRYPANGPYDV